MKGKKKDPRGRKSTFGVPTRTITIRIPADAKVFKAFRAAHDFLLLPYLREEEPTGNKTLNKKAQQIFKEELKKYESE